jgi:hypothetical protein
MYVIMLVQSRDKPAPQGRHSGEIKMKNAIKYVAGWSANNGSSYNDGYKYTSLADAKKSIKTICKGNVQSGSVGHWTITDTDGNEIEQGTIRR